MELIFFSTSLSYAQFLFTNVDNKIENWNFFWASLLFWQYLSLQKELTKFHSTFQNITQSIEIKILRWKIDWDSIWIVMKLQNFSQNFWKRQNKWIL
jgi:hypothetical protein